VALRASSWSTAFRACSSGPRAAVPSDRSCFPAFSRISGLSERSCSKSDSVELACAQPSMKGSRKNISASSKSIYIPWDTRFGLECSLESRTTPKAGIPPSASSPGRSKVPLHRHAWPLLTRSGSRCGSRLANHNMILGHASAAVTVTIYVHTEEKKKGQAMAQVL